LGIKLNGYVLYILVYIGQCVVVRIGDVLVDS